jgi:hypothetical protein
MFRNRRLYCRILFLLVLIMGLLNMCVRTNPSLAYPGFIDDAVKPAQIAQQETCVPASVSIAQAILESEWGNKHLGDANNYFGIKAWPRQDGTIDYGDIAIGYVQATTQEWNGTEYVTVQAYFRKYRSMEDSFRDHAYFFLQNPRYAEAMQHVSNPCEFARKIAQAGYATAPDYASNLTSLMDQYNLYQYDINCQAPIPGLSVAVIRRAEKEAPNFRPYVYGDKDCWRYVKHVWSSWFDLNIYDGGARQQDWVRIDSPDKLIPGDVLATHQGHQWGMHWHGGIYAEKDQTGQHWQWDCTDDPVGSGAYRRKLLYYPSLDVNDFEYYNVKIHQLLESSSNAKLDALLVGQSSSLVLKPRENSSIHFDIQNTGNISWIIEQGFLLENINSETLGAPSAYTLENEVPPGQVTRWEISIIAPEEIRSYSTELQMTYSGEPFGPVMSCLITVVPEEEINIDLIELLKGWFDELMRQISDKLNELWENLMQRLEEWLQRELERLWREFWESLFRQCCGANAIAPAVLLLGAWGINHKRRRGTRDGDRG